MNRREIILAGTMAALTSASRTPAAPEPGDSVIELWPGGAPGGDKVTVKEEIVERLPDGPLRDRFVQHVTRPLLTLFKPRTAYNGITLLIVPGGGYVRVVIDKEGVEAAEWFTQRGFAAAVLRYRLPADGWANGPDAPVQDAMRAMRLLRANAAKHGTPMRSIGVIGFSAGGHLCARLLTEPGITYARRDSADDLSARPDFGVLMYPVIAMTGPYAHAGSVSQLLAAGHGSGSESGSPVNPDGFAPHFHVGRNTPPTMLVHAADDTSVPLENSLLMYDALRKAGVRSELHAFDSGGHGFGLRSVAGKDVAAWPTLVQNWATNNATP
ncbi:MAG TPA: alpha/beta hydrolase [Steroidobacteraceae bacterium]|nr:alpha/beta hydrolase [Steroidobacteraceae bacterium]